MTDREKVIRGLECCVAYDYKCNDCPYQDDGGAGDGCYSDELKTDALALLKSQEPHKKGYWIYPLTIDCSCSECGNQPEHEPGGSIPLYDYCPYCGAEMAVKWE